VTIATICVWLPHDELTPLFGRSGHTLKNHRVLSIPEGVTEGEGSAVQTQRRKARETRYVAFGTSTTWGHGLENIETDPYPKLISRSADNLAVRAAGPGVPAMCLKSMVENVNPDGAYDVVFIEFYHRTLDPGDIDSFKIAVRRIRKRYPDAHLVFIRDWYIFGFIGFYNERGVWTRIEDWNERTGGEALHSDAFAEKVRVATKNGVKWEWYFKRDDRDVVLNEIAATVGGRIAAMEAPEKAEDFLPFRKFFDPDGHHLSPEGHKLLADRIGHLLEHLSIVDNPRVGPWDNVGDDMCVSWFLSGECPLEVHGDGVEMISWLAEKKSHPHYKYGLGFPNGGAIMFNNPFNKPMDMYLDFMREGPFPGIYPITEIIVETVGPNGSILSKPLYIDPSVEWVVHVVKPAFIGTVPPGNIIVHVRPLEEGKKEAFRIAGINLSETNDRFDTPEVYTIQPQECALLRPEQAPAANLRLSGFSDPKTIQIKQNDNERFDRVRVVKFVCNNVLNEPTDLNS